MAKSKKLQSAEPTRSVAAKTLEIINSREPNAKGKEQGEKPKQGTAAAKPQNKKTASKPTENKKKQATPPTNQKKTAAASGATETEKQHEIPVDPNQTELFEEQDKKPKTTTDEQATETAAASEPRKQQEPETATESAGTSDETAHAKKTPQEAARKYDEPTKSISFKFPLSLIDTLKDVASFYGINTTQYLLYHIKKDYEENKELIESIKKKRQSIGGMN